MSKQFVLKKKKKTKLNRSDKCSIKYKYIFLPIIIRAYDFCHYNQKIKKKLKF